MLEGADLTNATLRGADLLLAHRPGQNASCGWPRPWAGAVVVGGRAAGAGSPDGFGIATAGAGPSLNSPRTAAKRAIFIVMVLVTAGLNPSVNIGRGSR
jgi:uncharacterized protein YjbI with pentapeptide repeats